MAQNQNPGNFSNDREKASQAGKTGGQHSSGNPKTDSEHGADTGHKPGQQSGNFKNDPQKGPDTGHKGGSK